MSSVECWELRPWSTAMCPSDVDDALAELIVGNQRSVCCYSVDRDVEAKRSMFGRATTIDSYR